MAAQQAPGGHWSASNPVPTIQKFMEGLDKDKKERDRQIDEDNKRREEQKKRESKAGGDAVPHRVSEESTKRKGRTVRDPTTGKDIEIEDVDEDFTKSVEDPKVCWILFLMVGSVDADTRVVALSPECESWEAYGKTKQNPTP